MVIRLSVLSLLLLIIQLLAISWQQSNLTVTSDEASNFLNFKSNNAVTLMLVHWTGLYDHITQTTRLGNNLVPKIQNRLL